MFSGIEAASVAFAPLGWKALAFAEIEAFPSAVLAHHYPDVPNVGDMTAHDWSQYRGRCDLVVGGPPCQAFSIAGLRKSLQDDRGNLSLQYVRAVHAIDPLWCLTENVPGWLSTGDNAFGCFLGGLVGEDAPLVTTGGRWTDAGMVDGPERTAAWRILDAQYFGLAQRRRRVFVLSVRGSGNWRCAAALFPLTAGMLGDPPPSREAGEGVAPTIAARTRGGGGLGTDFDCDGGLIAPALTSNPWGDHESREGLLVASTVTSKWAKGSGGPAGDECQGLVVHSLRAEGFDASEDGTGRGVPLVAGTLRNHPRPGSNSLGAICFDEVQVTSVENRSNLQPGGPSHTLAAGARVPSIAFHNRQDPDVSGSVSHPLGAKDNGLGVLSASSVRRLIPRECERLQGFPDDYTRIPLRTFHHRKVTDSRPADRWEKVGDAWVLFAADGPRYKALGNSMAIPVIRWLGMRIAKTEEAFGRE